MAIKRSSTSETDGGSSVPLAGGDAAGYFPNVWEWITSESFDDGSPRKSSTLLCFVEEGRVKLCFSDRAESRKLWVSGSSPIEALEQLEGHLKHGTGEWRTDQGWNGSRKKK